MSKEALRMRISACEQEIEWKRREITKYEDKIEEYEYIRAKVIRGADNLSSFCSYQSRKICDMKNRHQKVRFVDSYIDDMTGYLQGQEYYAAMERFTVATDTLWRKRDMAISQIDSLREEIHNLENEIGMLQAQIREIERQEAEARRAAEEARRRAEEAYMAELNWRLAHGGR